jgi:hypothetical protein
MPAHTAAMRRLRLACARVLDGAFTAALLGRSFTQARWLETLG